MLSNFIYLVVAIILLIVIVIAGKAVNRGIEAKQKKNEEVIDDNDLNFTDNNSGFVEKISQLNKLHREGVLTDEEFKKAKEKILK